jgi:hypothetical protein
MRDTRQIERLRQIQTLQMYAGRGQDSIETLARRPHLALGDIHLGEEAAVHHHKFRMIPVDCSFPPLLGKLAGTARRGSSLAYCQPEACHCEIALRVPHHAGIDVMRRRYGKRSKRPPARVLKIALVKQYRANVAHYGGDRGGLVHAVEPPQQLEVDPQGIIPGLRFMQHGPERMKRIDIAHLPNFRRAPHKAHQQNHARLVYPMATNTSSARVEQLKYKMQKLPDARFDFASAGRITD